MTASQDCKIRVSLPEEVPALVNSRFQRWFSTGLSGVGFQVVPIDQTKNYHRCLWYLFELCGRKYEIAVAVITA